jgi:hypothetical protein
LISGRFHRAVIWFRREPKLLRRGTESPRRREAIDRRQHLAAKARTGEIVSERLAHPAMSSAGFIGTVMLLQAFAR